MEQAAKLVVEGEPFACDIGRFNDNYFVYVAAFGLLTDVSYQTPQDLKKCAGSCRVRAQGYEADGLLEEQSSAR